MHCNGNDHVVGEDDEDVDDVGDDNVDDDENGTFGRRSIMAYSVAEPRYAPLNWLATRNSYQNDCNQ